MAEKYTGNEIGNEIHGFVGVNSPPPAIGPRRRTSPQGALTGPPLPSPPPSLWTTSPLPSRAFVGPTVGRISTGPHGATLHKVSFVK